MQTPLPEERRRGVRGGALGRADVSDSGAAVKLVTAAVGALDRGLGRAEALRRSMLAAMATRRGGRIGRPLGILPCGRRSWWSGRARRRQGDSPLPGLQELPYGEIGSGLRVAG